MSEGGDYRELYEQELDRRRARQEAEELSRDLRLFVKGAWSTLKPDEPYQHNWHIDAICEHLMAVTSGEVRHLQIWIPRGMMKSLNVSVFWPAWEWTQKPWLRYWTAVYELGLAGRIAGLSRNVIVSPWYQRRWGHLFHLVKDGEKYFSNNKGGTRLATAPGSTGLGEHGHRVIIDDPINAQAADATSRVVLDATNEWYDATVQGSKANPSQAAEVIIMQRLHQNDLAQHAYDQDPSKWTVLCLPARFESDHPHAYFKDPRRDGELLWPSYLNEAETARREQTLGPYRRAGQMQQRPSSKEGDLLKRKWWRYYDPELFTDDKMKSRRPRFSMIVQTIDTPLKDKEANDQVAIQAWGIHGPNRYLLDVKVGHMSKAQAKRAIIEQANYVRSRKRFGRASYFILIENAGYGVELIPELKMEALTGVKKMSMSKEGTKLIRAESAAAALESGNCFIPGKRYAEDDVRLAADIENFMDELAQFPNGRFDDQVDAWSQCMNWLSGRPVRTPKVYSSFAGR